MKRFILAISIAALLAPGLSFAQEGVPAEPQKSNKLRMFKAGGIGCLAGGGLAYLTGKKDKAAAACAAGAVVGGIASYRAQVKEAQEVAEAAKAAGLDARVQTKAVETKDGQAEALDKLVIKYPVADMKSLNPATANTLDKLGALLKSSKEKLTVSFSGADTAVCAVPLVELAKRGALANATVQDVCGTGDYAITVSPIPDVR
ncbi:hypothetical protein ACIGHF_12195 [Stenotrophomonas sp. NPDC077464]|uniref:hypothetical protein n=1 Tax=unclassified Stenotrophomonas TaxID=196198 RepID=UPI0037D37A8A